MKPRASRCPSVGVAPLFAASLLGSRLRALLGADSTSDCRRMDPCVEGSGATPSSAVSHRLGLPRRFLPTGANDSCTAPAGSSGLWGEGIAGSSAEGGSAAGGASGGTSAVGFEGVPQNPNPPDSAFAGLSEEEPPPIPKNLEMASQEELFFGVGLRSAGAGTGVLATGGMDGGASCPGESPWLFSGSALLFLGIGLGEGVFSLSARFCQWSDISSFCGPSLDRLEWFAHCGPWSARPSQHGAGSRSRNLSMDFRSSDWILPTSGTPWADPMT